MNKVARAAIFLLVALFLAGPIFAADSPKLEDRFIGSAFKALAKAFVAVTDIDKLKDENIRKINKMDEEKFRMRYAKAYEVIKGLPTQLKTAYRIKENTSKEDAAMSIKSLDKNKAYEIIDAVPDKLIADQFRQYLKKKKQDMQKSNLAIQISQFWDKVTGSIRKSR